MEIEIFTICDHAQDTGGKLFIIGTFDMLNAPSFPMVYPAFTIAGRMRFSRKETGEHSFRIRALDPQGKELIQSIEGQINIGEPPAFADYTSTNFVINLQQVKLEHPGTYTFELYLDDEWKTGLKLMAIKPQ
ncbi:DUF6941 family protein [Flaviaesturariibacter amylovorans]|uniref:DUF1842 domain-containing protein n=1 Tax=Flaviaesturariibacter amylovorans TaxID=1084520 RepID=A0ABP8HEX5_9BACT